MNERRKGACIEKMKVKQWTINPQKFLSETEIKRLQSTIELKAQLALHKGQRIAIRDYFIVNLALSTGLRAMEIVALRCGDVHLRDHISYLWIENGKGGKQRIVFFNDDFKIHCEEYLRWKRQIGESIESDAPLIFSSNSKGHLSTRAVEKTFKRCAKEAGLSSTYAIHSLRHTYASFLLKASGWNLRLVQKQLGHSRVSTTQVYADIMIPDIANALDKLYK
jgi:site-specific recombinase XerD